MKTAKQLLNKVVECFCIFLITVMVLLVAWQIFVRYVLNNPSSISETLTRYMFVWLVTVTATYAFGSRDHMCISYLKDKLDSHIKPLVNIVIELLNIFFAGAVMVYGGARITHLQMVQLDANLHIPTGIIYCIIPICGVIIIFYAICNLMDDWNMLKTKKEEH